ncbi:AraC family transcriptional regulator [Flavobacterium beibuense]|uniref:TPR repeat-containing protein n=1 Tax=Flavobacterium beibuense TaxID=657326 RepID=A0A444WEL8_9FLAO|nr:AraC family transcriptional regulator [Flavobacterium beibuense]RYJ44298.1 TPR repeat-containing protein [Flavobacterium beibuense]
MIQRTLVFITILFLCSEVLCQEKAVDSLCSHSFDQLYSHIEKYSGQKEVWPYLQAYLIKAKKSIEWDETVNAYHYILSELPDDQRMVYADSMIYAAEKSESNKVIGSAYLTKGILFYNRKNHTQALDNYVIANRYLSRVNDDYLKYKLKYNIGLIKYYLGFYNEAVSLFRECVNYFEQEDRRAYLNALHCLALSYNRLGKITESVTINDKAFQEARSLKRIKIMPYILQLKGVNLFYVSDYKDAIAAIKGVLPQIKKDGDFGNEAVGLFYIGRSYWELGEKQQAVSYFKNVDRIFLEKNYIRPDLRQNYELLIDYYKQQENLKMQLYYINRLLKVDKLMARDYRYLSAKIHKEYDTTRLIEAKNSIQKELEREKNNRIILVVVIVVLMICLGNFTYFHLNTNKRWKKNFEELMANKDKPRSALVKTSATKNLDINPEVVGQILRKLELFEKRRCFLKKDINASMLASGFQTNYKYLTKVIHFHREKNFTAYLNDLRVDYIITQLQSDAKLRLYTNSALADEAGFSTTQHFTKAFQKKAGMSPTFFINELNKSL